MRIMCASFAALALVACQPAAEAPTQGSPAAAPAAADLTAGGCVMNAQLRKTYADHEWYQIARQADGAFIQFAPKQMVCDRAARRVDAAIQIIHRNAQTAAFEDAEAIERIEYTRERYLYRIDCANRTFAIVQRQIMGAGEQVLKTVPMLRNDEGDWRPITTRGPVSQLEGPACRVALGPA